MPTLKLDDLRPANTFERRLLEYLVEGGTLDIKVEHVGQEDLDAMQARIDALAQMVAAPQVITVSEQSQTDLRPILEEIERVKAQHMELLRLVQKIAKDADETAAKLRETAAAVKALEPLSRLEVHSELMKVLFKVGGANAA